MNGYLWIYLLNLAAWQRVVVGSVRHRLKRWMLAVGMLRLKAEFCFGSIGPRDYQVPYCLIFFTGCEAGKRCILWS